MAIFGIFDLFVGVGLIVGLIAAGVTRMRSVKVIVWETGGPAPVRRGRGAVVALLICGVALVLLVLLNVAYFNGFGTDPVIDTPTPAQVTGTWAGHHGATLVLRPDGTFTASGLPPYVGLGTGMPKASAGIPPNPPSGHGRWTIGPGDFSGPPESVIFTFSCATGCANQNLTFDLQAETSSPSGGPALFWYLGDPDSWSNQYAFVRAK